MTTKLDVERFRKVQRLMEAGATDGERSSARSRAETIAAAAGLTLEEALSKLDTSAEPAAFNFFAGFDDWMEAREPGWKVQKALEYAERERKRMERCAEYLKEFGSEDAVFDETDRELLLRVTLEPLADRERYLNDTETYIRGYAGWTSGRPIPVLWAAIEDASALPTDITGAWREYQEWQYLLDARVAFCPDYSQQAWIRAREEALEHLLNTVPASTLAEFDLRLEWLGHLQARGTSGDDEDIATLIAQIRADFAALSHHIRNQRGTSARSTRRRSTASDAQGDLFAT